MLGCWQIFWQENDRPALGQNALETALRYREDAVAMQAASYYNTIKLHSRAGTVAWLIARGNKDRKKLDKGNRKWKANITFWWLRTIRRSERE